MVDDRERRVWWLSVASLPLLVAAAVAINAWRSIENYGHRIETVVAQGSKQRDYVGATWRLENVGLIGDGRDAEVRFPG